MASGSRGLLAVVVVVMVVAVLGVPPPASRRTACAALRHPLPYPGSRGQLRGRHGPVLATGLPPRAPRGRPRRVALASFGKPRTSLSVVSASAAITLIVSPRVVTHPHQRRPCGAAVLIAPAGRLHGHLGDPFRFPRVDPGQASPRDEERRHVLDVVPLPLRGLLLCSGLGIAPSERMKRTSNPRVRSVG